MLVCLPEVLRLNCSARLLLTVPWFGLKCVNVRNKLAKTLSNKRGRHELIQSSTNFDPGHHMEK